MSSFRFGWVRERDATSPERPNVVAAQENLTGTDSSVGQVALDIGGGGGTHSLMDEPIDVGTQVARKQSNDNRNFQWNADFVWSRGRQLRWRRAVARGSASAMTRRPSARCVHR